MPEVSCVSERTQKRDTRIFREREREIVAYKLLKTGEEVS